MLQVPLKLSHFNEVFVQPVAHGRTLVEERVPGGILAAMPEMAQMRCEFKVSQGHLGWFVTEQSSLLQLSFQPESHRKTPVHNSKAFFWVLISGKIKSTMALHKCPCFHLIGQRSKSERLWVKEEGQCWDKNSEKYCKQNV